MGDLAMKMNSLTCIEQIKRDHIVLQPSIREKVSTIILIRDIYRVVIKVF